MGGMRPPEGDQAGPTQCRWHSEMRDCVHSMGSNWCGPRGMRPHCIGINWSCGISKPTSVPTTRVQHSAFIPQSGLVEVGFHLGHERVGGWVQKRTKEGSNPQGMSLTKRLEAETATRPKIQPRLKHRGKDKPLALESWSLLQA